MADLVRVRNKNHGGVTSLPESALPNFPNWEPVDGPTPLGPRPKRAIKSQPNAATAASENEE